MWERVILEVISALITGLVVSVVGGVFFYYWRRSNRCLANALKAREMYNDILLSGKPEGSNYAMAAIVNVLDFIAIARERGELDENEYLLWVRTLYYFDKNYPKKLAEAMGAKEDAWMSAAFTEMLKEARKL